MAQNYTRQSSFTDGDTITSDLFNNEYNQLVNAFTYSSVDSNATGHTHDGSLGQGGNIYKIGDIDFLNKIEISGTNNRMGFFVKVSGVSTEQVRISDGLIAPVTTNDIDLGTNSLQFKDLYIDGTANIDSLVLSSGATVTSILDEDDFVSNSAIALATQQSIKAYSDSATQTLTNKTINASSNTISNLNTTHLASGVLDTDLSTVAATHTTIPSAKAVYDFVADLAGTSNPIFTGTVSAETVNISTALNLGDNVKASFGDSDDLQIVHDGSNSYISDLGTGDTVIQTNGNRIGLALASPFEWMVEANVNGSVNLHYDGSAKLATTATGIDVTGSVTADGLTVDGSAVLTGSVTADAGYFFGGTNSYLYESASDTANLRVGSDGPYMLLGNDLGSNVAGMGNSSGGLALYAGTEKVRITSSGNVGIGNTSPSYKLSVGDGTADTRSVFASNNAFSIGVSNASGFAGWIGGSGVTDNMVFSNSGGTERMRIDSSGNVGIGTSSAGQKLTVAGNIYAIGSVDARNATATQGATLSTDGSVEIARTAGDPFIDFKSSLAEDYDTRIQQKSNGLAFETGGYTSSIERLRITSSGNVGIGTSSPSYALDVVGDGRFTRSGTTSGNIYLGGNSNYVYADAVMAFGVGGTERMRIDSSGNLGINTTSPSTTLDVNGTATANHFKHGNITTTATSKTIVAGEFCNVTASTQTITLPASPSAGDTVRIGVNNFTDTVVARNSSNIMSLAENLTIDKANVLLTLTYVDSSIGWRIY